MREPAEQRFGSEAGEKSERDLALKSIFSGAGQQGISDGPKDALIAFGELWVLHSGKKKYKTLMDAGGTCRISVKKAPTARSDKYTGDYARPPGI